MKKQKKFIYMRMLLSYIIIRRNWNAKCSESDWILTIPEGDDQKKTVLKEQDERQRHGIEGLLNRVIAYVRLIYSGFQPPYNFTPESRATPTKGREFPKEIRAGVRRNNAVIYMNGCKIASVTFSLTFLQILSLVR